MKGNSTVELNNVVFDYLEDEPVMHSVSLSVELFLSVELAAQ